MKVWNYTILFIVLILLIRFMGFETGGDMAMQNFTSLTWTNSSDPNCPNCVSGFDFTFSDLWDLVFDAGIGILIGVGVSAIAASLFSKGQTENYILLPFLTGVLWLFLQTFIAIINYAWALKVYFVSMLVSLICIPLAVGYLLAMLEWFRGTD